MEPGNRIHCYLSSADDYEFLTAEIWFSESILCVVYYCEESRSFKLDFSSEWMQGEAKGVPMRDFIDAIERMVERLRGRIGI